MDETFLGERELDVMGVLWASGSGTVTEVRDQLHDELAYTTVLTVLRNLEAKGFVRHESEGKAHRYYPRVAQRAARQRAITRLIERLFGGSAEQLVAHLVEERALTEEHLQRIGKEVSATRDRSRR